MAEPVYRPVIWTALGLFRALGFRFDVRGVEHLPADGPAVLAANHVSYFDFMFVGLAAHLRGHRLVRFLAKESVFRHPVSGPLMRGMHHIPVDRRAGAAAYDAARQALTRGELVGVFPESTISRSFLPREMKSGAARLARDTAAPLLPVVTWGGQRLWTAGRRPRLRFGTPISIRVGPPIPVDDDPVETTDRLRQRLAALVDDVIRDYPDPPAPGAFWCPAAYGGSAPTPEAAAAAEAAAIAGRRVKVTSR